MSEQEPVRVLVVDDQQLIREGIASLLGIQPGITVVGMASDGREAVEKAIALDPDVVLMDVRMPECDGAQATDRIRRERPGCQVVMLTTFDDEEYVVQALRAGAAGYCSRICPPANSPMPYGWHGPASRSSTSRPPAAWRQPWPVTRSRDPRAAITPVPARSGRR